MTEGEVLRPRTTMLSLWPYRTLCFVFLLVPISLAGFNQDNNEDMPHKEVEHWAQTIGNHVYHLLNKVAKYPEIEGNYRSEGASITDNDGLTLVKQMAKDVSNMMKFKVQAVERIMNVAEEVSQDPRYLQEEFQGYYNSKAINQGPEYFEALEERYDDRLHEYYGTKLNHFKKLDLFSNSHFQGLPISLNVSTVHVPTNVFEGGPNVRKAIRWSEALEKTFYSNYEHDPTLSWQYFGSATGFLRQFPGSEWQMDAEDPDLYDARLRPWYIQAANSPKDMVILLDISGSMTGLRKEISKHVVLNILDTLNDNDFVNIFVFSEDTVELVPCFNDTLVQANLENIGEFKKQLDDLKTENIANFSLALTKAFKLLQKANPVGHGAQCNQAIMLITDGAPYTYEAIFDEFNWPHKQIRIFTYLIGREVTEIRPLSWMACANNGYFVHVTTPSEVREQVLKYIPVVARPMVMYKDKHPVIWTGVYADIAHPYRGFLLDPKQTAWLWELRERDRQMRRTTNFRKLKQLVESKASVDYQDELDDKKKVEKFLQYGEFGLSETEITRINAERASKIRGHKGSHGLRKGYRLMTTVSVPVFNRTDTKNVTERILVDDSVWVLRSREEKVADLLGVASTDVPIREIEKLVPPYKLGVNGYSFMVNKNGYVIYHPDLRPTFQDILKPNYNSVDLAEVELIDSDEARTNHSDLSSLRRDMIEQRSSVTNFKVRVHQDKMKRVEIREQHYFTSKVGETPFSLGISLPKGYGKFRVVGQIELSLEMKENRKFNASDFFNSGNWSLHPEWVYCEYKYDQGVDRNPEEQLLHFLSKAQMPGWKWRSTRTRPPPDSSSSQGGGMGSQTRGHQSHYDESEHYCDKNLVQSLLFDARATDVYNDTNKFKQNFGDDKKRGGQKNFGIVNSFVATRSGLSRWFDIDEDFSASISSDRHFMDMNNRATDEVWYKRAVDYYEEDPEAYVYSVPFDAATRDPTTVLVTASRAIFIKKNKFQKAPAAVVGVNIKLDKFMEFFQNETYNCREFSHQSTCRKDMTCSSESLDCYLLDDNGFVVGSEKNEDSGRFFGEIEGTIMESLVQSEVYNRIKIYDYQAVCLDNIREGSFASILATPYQLVKYTISWLMTNMVWLLVKTQIYQWWDPNQAWAYTYGSEDSPPPSYSDYGNTPPMTPSEFDNMQAEHQNNRPPQEPPTREVIEIDYLTEEDPARDEFSIDLASISQEVNLTEGSFEDDLFSGSGSGSGDGDNMQANQDYHEVYEEDEPFPKLDLAYINKTRPRPCDKEVNLYKLNNSKLKEGNSDKYKPVKGKLSNCHSNGCGRPFSVQKVIHSNLVMIVVHNLCPCESRTVSIEPQEVGYTEEEHCERLLLNHFRQRPADCQNYHPDEIDINDCGNVAKSFRPTQWMVILTVFICLVRQLQIT